MNKKYIVRLTDEERAICEATIKKETGKSEKLRRATILLKADADGPGWDDARISEAVGCRTRLKADLAVSTVGFAGPGEVSPEKPVGLVYSGLAWEGGTSVVRFNWTGGREEVQRRAAA